MSSPVPRRKAPTGRRLACAQCQNRKIKCDRTTPCRQCVQAGLQCEDGNRKSDPGRSKGKPNHELRERLQRLETMFEEMNQTGGSPRSTSGTQQFAVSIPTEQHPSPVNKYVGSKFWASLTCEVHAIREALAEPNDETDDGEEEDSPWTSSSAVAYPSDADSLQDASGIDFILCAPARIYALPGSLPESETSMQSTLLEIYIDRIDVAWKIFHVPTLRAFMQNGQHYLGRPAAAPCNRALRATIFFAAISQVSNEECEQIFQQPHARVLDHLRRYAEAILAQADVISNTSLASLQAFTVFVATARRHDTNHRSWALFGLLIRLARAANLDRESSEESFFQQQLNRRLWHHLCCLDSFFAYDRGSEVSIAAGSYSRPFPININDDGFDESSPSQPRIASSEGVSDMNFALMLHELYTVAHRLPAQTAPSWQKQLERTNDLHGEISKRYTQHCNSAVAFQRLTIRISRCIQAINVLDVVRAGKSQQNGMTSNARPSTEYILELAVDVLRKCEELRQDVELAQWNRLDWVQWQPLAVILACLCSIRGTPLAEEAWTMVNLAMGRAAQHIADTTKGRLWQPLIKIYKKALAFRYQEQQTQLVAAAAPLSRTFVPWSTPPPVLMDPEVVQNAQLNMDGWQLQVQSWMLAQDDCQAWSQSLADSNLASSQWN